MSDILLRSYYEIRQTPYVMLYDAGTYGLILYGSQQRQQKQGVAIYLKLYHFYRKKFAYIFPSFRPDVLILFVSFLLNSEIEQYDATYGLLSIGGSGCQDLHPCQPVRVELPVIWTVIKGNPIFIHMARSYSWVARRFAVSVIIWRPEAESFTH